MALTKVVTKLWPTSDNRNIFHPGIRLVLFEDAVEVRSQDFSRDFKMGGDPAAIKADIITEAQAYIDKYKKERQINDAVAYDNAVSDIDGSLVL